MLGKIEALRQVPFLRQLDGVTVQEILERCVEKTYFKNETLFLEGEAAKGLIVVWRGSVKIYKTSEQGREQILAVEGPGRSVAELPLFDGLPYPASCAAIEDAVVLLIPAPDFHRLLARHPELTRAVIASLAFRLRRMVGLVQELSLKAVRERLAGLILELAGDADSVDLPWTHQEIAARIGTVREIVSRTLGKMVQDGAIRLDGKTVTLLDRDRL